MAVGLENRYNVTKTNGEPVDPKAVYFVLRLDAGGNDPYHIAACRKAVRGYVEHIVRVQRNSSGADHLRRLADDLHRLVENLDYQDRSKV